MAHNSLLDIYAVASIELQTKQILIYLTFIHSNFFDLINLSIIAAFVS